MVRYFFVSYKLTNVFVYYLLNLVCENNLKFSSISENIFLIFLIVDNILMLFFVSFFNIFDCLNIYLIGFFN